MEKVLGTTPACGIKNWFPGFFWFRTGRKRLKLLRKAPERLLLLRPCGISDAMWHHFLHTGFRITQTDPDSGFECRVNRCVLQPTWFAGSDPTSGHTRYVVNFEQFHVIGLTARWSHISLGCEKGCCFVHVSIESRTGIKSVYGILVEK